MIMSAFYEADNAKEQTQIAKGHRHIAKRIGRDWYLGPRPLRCGHLLRNTKSNKCYHCTKKGPAA